MLNKLWRIPIFMHHLYASMQHNVLTYVKNDKERLIQINYLVRYHFLGKKVNQVLFTLQKSVSFVIRVSTHTSAKYTIDKLVWIFAVCMNLVCMIDIVVTVSSRGMDPKNRLVNIKEDVRLLEITLTLI